MSITKEEINPPEKDRNVLSPGLLQSNKLSLGFSGAFVQRLEFFGGHTVKLFKFDTEIIAVIKTAVLGNFGNRGGG